MSAPTPLPSLESSNSRVAQAGQPPSEWDVAVLGGGPAGYVAALRATQLGLRCCLLERAELGGVCLNWGCIPTKSLLRSAEVLRLLQRAGEFGLRVGAVEADPAAMFARARQVAEQLRRGIEHLLKKSGVTVLRGEATLLGGGGMLMQPLCGHAQTLKAKHIVVATGARARRLETIPQDVASVWTYREALQPPKLPATMVVLGAGAIGIEFACFYSALGVAVTVVEMADRILPLEDQDVSQELTNCLKRDGIKLCCNARVSSAHQVDGQWVVELEGPDASSTIYAEVLLQAIGIVGNVEHLGLERTAIDVRNGHIVIDSNCRTAEPGIYAIGDVAGPPWLAHKASYEAVRCIELIAGLNPQPLDTQRIPACIYSQPQVASLGLTEALARSRGHAVKIGRFALKGNGKALALGESEGFVKVIFDEHSGELLGAHLLGPEVTELIQSFAISQTLEATADDLLSTVLPHPTLSEALSEAVLAAYGKALHT